MRLHSHSPELLLQILAFAKAHRQIFDDRLTYGICNKCLILQLLRRDLIVELSSNDVNSVVELHWIITHDWIIAEAPLAFDKADLESAVTDASPLDIDGLPWRILNFLAFILNLAGHFVALAFV